jgi:hypothetical protein
LPDAFLLIVEPSNTADFPWPFFGMFATVDRAVPRAAPLHGPIKRLHLLLAGGSSRQTRPAKSALR